MIIPVIGILTGLAALFTIVAFVLDDYIRSLFSTLISLVMWFSLAAGSAQVGLAYVTGAGTTDIYQIEGPESFLAWIYLFMGVIMIAYLWVIVMDHADKTGSGFR